jgi:hypothetical protein
MRSILVLPAILALAGCVSAPIISNPAEGPHDKAEGNVKALPELLNGKKKAVVVFVHGVGDHCPGFAIANSKDAWLNDDTRKALGLVSLDAEPAYTDILDHEFLPDHPTDLASKVTVGVRHYTFPASALPKDRIPVDAIEITWSQLTQWVKTNQLGYDLTEPLPQPSTTYPGCPYPQKTDYKKPPAREWLNRVLKEPTLDRSLADAVIYAGAYGRVMRRGTAEAICRAAGGTQNSGGHLCHWPIAPEGDARTQTAYFFVTHSLGSRLMYDTLLGLTGKDVTTTAHTFDPAEVEDAKAFAGYLMVETGAAYMMANQLTMLGLAYEDGTHTSGEGPAPYLLQMHDAALGNTLKNMPQLQVSVTAAQAAPQATVKTAALEFAAKRLQLASGHGEAVAPLTVVAFSDTNDLLSWAVPKWYQGDDDGAQHAVDFTNVFVQTATRWLGLFENPADAHAGYFTSADVWHVIQCGASTGKLNACQK